VPWKRNIQIQWAFQQRYQQGLKVQRGFWGQAERAQDDDEAQREVSGVLSVARQWLAVHQAEEEARAQGTWRPAPGGPRAAEADPETGEVSPLPALPYR
jgi:hypothetical protein